MMPSIFDEPRYTEAPAFKDVPESLANYAAAEDMARAIELSANMRHYQMVSGAFIFGDFIEYIPTPGLLTVRLHKRNIEMF